jgi:hypothetical protein
LLMPARLRGDHRDGSNPPGDKVSRTVPYDRFGGGGAAIEADE